jgi:hypothetical protein
VHQDSSTIPHGGATHPSTVVISTHTVSEVHSSVDVVGSNLDRALTRSVRTKSVFLSRTYSCGSPTGLPFIVVPATYSVKASFFAGKRSKEHGTSPCVCRVVSLVP